MKYRFYFTPWGWLVIICSIALLVGAGILDSQPSGGGVLSKIMIAIGLLLLLLVFGYIRTARNIKRKNKEAEEIEKELNNPEKELEEWREWERTHQQHSKRG